MKFNEYHISDTHFNCDKILVYSEDTRPFSSIEEHDEYIVKVWNHYVRPFDVVYHHGDVGYGDFRRIKDIHSRLNGVKVLIRGNHDKYTVSKYKELGYSHVFQELKTTIGKHIRLKHSHAPYLGVETKYKDLEERALDIRPVPEDGYWLVCGHVHGLFKVDLERRVINVSWDVWKRPVSRGDLMSIIQRASVTCNALPACTTH